MLPESYSKLATSLNLNLRPSTSQCIGMPADMRLQPVAVQALRQSLLKKYAAIRIQVERLHNSRMSPYEKLECHESIRSEVAASWRTDEIRRQKPTPQACRPCCHHA